jgi:hypothetical protein
MAAKNETPEPSAREQFNALAERFMETEGPAAAEGLALLNGEEMSRIITGLGVAQEGMLPAGPLDRAITGLIRSIDQARSTLVSAAGRAQALQVQTNGEPGAVTAPEPDPASGSNPEDPAAS